MAERISVRLAVSSDFEVMKVLLSDLYGGSVTFPQDRWIQVLAKQNIKVYVATSDGTVVGTASLTRGDKVMGPVWLLEDVVVSGEHRSGGIGGKLVSHVLAVAKGLGASCIDLSSRHRRAEEFYKRHGFENKVAHGDFYAMRCKL
ncbi:MAG: GNAT family N-acetyltransferase [Patescibacteria group bacterium]